MKKIVLKQLETKEELLEHYAKKEPNLFLQIDGYSKGERSDEQKDKDGNAISIRDTYELMDSCPDVRVLISHKAEKKEIIFLQNKITNLLKNNYELLEPDREKKRFEELSQLLLENNFSESFVGCYFELKDNGELP